MVDQPQDNGPGNRCPPPSSDAAGQLIDVAGGWARETAGSGQVSGAMVHVSKRMMVTLLAPDAGYGKSTGPPSDVARRSANIAGGTFDVCSNAAVNSDLSCFLSTGRLKRLYLHC